MEIENRTCFVIGPIGAPDSEQRQHADMLLNNVLKPVLEPKKFEVIRSDEVSDPGMINDRVIHDIINAGIAIADLSFHNPNAFYELGLRHAHQKPTIHFTSPRFALPFDNIGYRTIIADILTWSGTVAARKQFEDAVEAIEKDGYKVSNPVTQANAAQLLLASNDPKDEKILSLQSRIETLEKLISLQSSEKETGMIFGNLDKASRRAAYKLIYQDTFPRGIASRVLSEEEIQSETLPP